MMRLYDGHQNNLKPRGISASKTDMPDLPMKSGLVSNKTDPVAKKYPVRKRTPVAKKPVKPLPTTLQGEQPRDRLGRFARKTGQVIMGVAKGTVKGVKSVHKTVKRARAVSRKHHALEMRERAVILREREKKLSRRKRVARKRK